LARHLGLNSIIVFFAVGIDWFLLWELIAPARHLGLNSRGNISPIDPPSRSKQRKRKPNCLALILVTSCSGKPGDIQLAEYIEHELGHFRVQNHYSLRPLGLYAIQICFATEVAFAKGSGRSPLVESDSGTKMKGLFGSSENRAVDQQAKGAGGISRFAPALGVKTPPPLARPPIDDELPVNEQLNRDETGWTSKRTVVLAFGFDEEASGTYRIDYLASTVTGLEKNPFAVELSRQYHSGGGYGVERVIGSTPLGQIELSQAFNHELEPTPWTPTSGKDSGPWDFLSGTIKATYDAHRSFRGTDGEESKNKSVIVASPGMSTGNTMEPHEAYLPVQSQEWCVWREIATGVHTVNENIPLDHYLEMIRFFSTLILNADEAEVFE
ncbi:hypothetical protein GGU10DRAFT_337381, partial [Lentinula aff. detonsa]